MPPGGGNDAVNHRRGNRSEIPPAEFPLLADQASNFGPLVAFECGTYLPRDSRDFFEVLGDAAVAINVPHEDFPVVDSGLPRLARITKHQAAFQLIQIAAKRLAPFAPRCEDDGGGASKCRRVMVLRARRHADDDRLDVPADVNPVFAAEARSCQTIERRANRHGHGGRAADPRTSGSFGIGSECETARWAKHADEVCQQRQPIAPRAG